jgi:hypothetical protein
MFETIVVLTYAFIANILLVKFSWLCYITLYNANILSSQCFSTNQIRLLQIFALLLQIFALLFGIKCTETNQSQSSNIYHL